MDRYRAGLHARPPQANLAGRTKSTEYNEVITGNDWVNTKLCPILNITHRGNIPIYCR